MIEDRSFDTEENRKELQRLKLKYEDDYIDNNPYLNHITDEIYLRFIDVISLGRKYKNPLFVKDKIPPIFALIDIRQKVKPFSKRARAGLKVLKIFLKKSRDKEFMNTLKIKFEKNLNKEFKKRGLEQIDFDKYKVEDKK